MFVSPPHPWTTAGGDGKLLQKEEEEEEEEEEESAARTQPNPAQPQGTNRVITNDAKVVTGKEEGGGEGGGRERERKRTHQT